MLTNHEKHEVYELNLPENCTPDAEYARLRSAHEILTWGDRPAARLNLYFILIVTLIMIAGGLAEPIILIILPLLIKPLYRSIHRSLMIDKEIRAIQGLLQRFQE